MKTLFTRKALSGAFIAAAVALASAPAAAAPVQLYGGGATLPANAYVGPDWLTFNPKKRLSNTDPASPNPASANSLFAKQANDAFYPAYVQYCQTGSGRGRSMITGSTPDATIACGDYAGPTPNGFSAGAAKPNFAASDTPFSASDYSTFLTNRGATNGAMFQFPAVAGNIVVAFNNSDIGADGKLNLTVSQVCQIFAGQITNWKTLNKNYTSKPIKLVVRSDNSGTTFSMMNFLSAACPTAIPTAVAGFRAESVFQTGAIGAVLPAGTIASSGNGGVITSIVATDGSIGYAEASDTKTRKTLDGASNINWATISKRPSIKDANGTVIQKFIQHDPFVSKAVKLKVSTLSDKVIGSLDANGRPVLIDQTPGVPAAAGCMQIVDPNTYAVPADNAKGDYANYPIVAISYLMGFYQGNEGGKKLKALRNLIASPYTVDANVTTIGVGTGFTWVGVPSFDATAAARMTGTPSMSKLTTSCINL